MDAPFLALISIAGVINAWLLGAVILADPARRRRPQSVRLALFLLAAGYLLGVFIFWHFGWLSYGVAARVVHDTVVLFASALFLDHVVCTIREQPVHPVAYVPGAVYLIAGIAIGEALVARITIANLVAAQMAYTVAATVIAVRAAADQGNRMRRAAVVMPLAALWTLHAVQLLRIALPENLLVFNLVPLAGALMLIAFNVYVLRRSPLLSSGGTAYGSPAAPLPASLAQLEDHFRRERPYLNPGLKAGDLAAALGITSRQLSTLLNRDAGCSFYEYLQRHRVDEAKRLLASPDERRTSVEAIGLMSGFRSRSTFYETFRRDTGRSPARFRREPGPGVK